MLSIIAKLNERLDSSLTDLYYFMILLFSTYLIIPAELMIVLNKLSVYIPNLPYTFSDYIQFYQIICTLTVVTFLVSNWILHASSETIPTIIYTVSGTYTFILLIIVNGSKLHEDNALVNFFHNSSILVQNTNPIIFGATLIVISVNILIILLTFLLFTDFITEIIKRISTRIFH